MFTRFSSDAIKVMVLAEEEARRLGSSCVGTEMILLGLIAEEEGIAAMCSKEAGADLDSAREKVESIAEKSSTGTEEETPFSPRSKRILEFSWEESKRRRLKHIGCEHLLLGIIREAYASEECSGAAKALQALDIELVTLMKAVLAKIEHAKHTEQPLASMTESSLESLFEEFSQGALAAIMLAQEEARRMGHPFVGTETVLLGLLGEGDGIAAKALKQVGVDLETSRKEVEKILGVGSGFVGIEIPITPKCKKILEHSRDEARQLGGDCIDTEHLLLAIIRSREGVAVRVLENMASIDDLLSALVESSQLPESKQSTGSEANRKTYYQILQVDPEAELGLIEQAYKYLIERTDPAISEYEKIEEAWSIISDEKKRAEYDRATGPY